MSSKTSPPFRNFLLQALSKDDIALISPKLEAIELHSRRECEKANRPIKHIYFPESGIASVVARGPRQKPLEIALIGCEGMSGIVVLMGNDRSPHDTYMQVAGRGYRIAAEDFRSAMRESETLREKLLCYAQAFMIQVAHTAISNANGKLEERLARWLLMAHDRIDGDGLPIIHDFLALMLSVRRAGVTVALHRLEHDGLINPERGRIVVLDRNGLKEVAGGSYGVPEAEYARLMRRKIRA